MTTYAQAIAGRGAEPVIVVTIDGVGEYGGIWKFCTTLPTYTATTRYKAYLGNYPQLLAENTHPLGGVSGSGELQVEIVDVDDELTGRIARTEARPQTRITAGITSAVTTVTVESNTGITAGSSMGFMGVEAFTFDSISAGTTWNITRGALGTTASAHDQGDPVWLFSPYMLGRRMRVYLAFNDDDYGGTETEIGGGWHLDPPRLGSGLNSWVLTGSSPMKYLDRLLYRNAFRGTLILKNPETKTYLVYSTQTQSGSGAVNDVHPHHQDRIFYRVGDEVVRVDPDRIYLGQFVVDKYGAAGTHPSNNLKEGEEIYQVFAADTDEDYGSFRAQDQNAESSSKSAPSWVSYDHPVPIILSLLTSKSDVSDNNADNFETGKGNFSGLPPGIGLGIPGNDSVSRIDYDSFLAVWNRTRTYSMRNFILEDSQSGRDVIDRICRATGYDLKLKDGKLYLDAFRLPLADETGAVFDDSSILTEESGEGHRVPRLSAVIDKSLVASQVAFTLRNSRGKEIRSVWSSDDIKEQFGNIRGDYQLESRAIEIDATDFQADANGAEPEVIQHRALQILYRYRRPVWRINVTTDLSLEATEAGDFVYLTHSQFPDMTNGTRGVTNLLCKVLSKEVRVDPDGARIDWEIISYNQEARVGRVSPSAMITSVASNTATVEENRYTDPDALGDDITEPDANAFTVGDVVRLVDTSGVPIGTSPETQTIQSISGNDIELDSNFGGAAEFASGYVIEYANADDQAEQQQNGYVSMADDPSDGSSDVGTTFSGDPWAYGEP